MRAVERSAGSAEERPGEVQDALLMERLARGDLEALGELYLRHGALVRSVAYNHLPSGASQGAEDLCQEVFLALVELAPRYREEGKLRGVLAGLAMRKAWASRRKDRTRRSLLGRLFGGGEKTTAGGQGLADVQRDLDRALAQLPEAQREVLLLHSVETLSGEEIAEALGISVNTVWTRLHRARARLEELLGEEGGPR